MKIHLDGMSREVPEGVSLTDLLRTLGEPVPHVIVELNGRYIAAKEFDRLTLKPEDRLEVILPAFGG